MPSKIGLVSRDFLENAPLPQHGSTYTVISHKFVIDTVKEELNDKGFFIEEESYRATTDAAIATGVYKLTYKADPELSMAFAWTNSYNKQVKFKAVIGAISNVNGSLMILGDQGSWVRKHTGTADVEAKEQIVNQIKSANIYYQQLIKDRDVMKDTPVTKRKQAELLGILFADYGILEVTCANAVKQQMIKPPFVYSGGSETLWAFYNHVIYSIQDNHPKTWLEEQRMIHYVITNEFNMIPVPQISAPIVEEQEVNTETVVTEDDKPDCQYKQLDLEEVIAEAEAEETSKLDIDASHEEKEFLNQPIADENLESMTQESKDLKQHLDGLSDHLREEEESQLEVMAENSANDDKYERLVQEEELSESEEDNTEDFLAVDEEDDDEDDYDFL